MTIADRLHAATGLKRFLATVGPIEAVQAMEDAIKLLREKPKLSAAEIVEELEAIALAPPAAPKPPAPIAPKPPSKAVQPLKEKAPDPQP
ncbi:MAG: hypothetical protein N3Z28_05250 [Synechococcaceae cyanobacterium MAG-AL2]|uniref:hypothetical protein n=1 Tax=Candidatus Regnicoccus frigidus TaxID=3074015 RepID=UPI00281F70D6|nr:hypothetical protein [Candidatus Regnicoccus frigidus]MCT4367061.1 hypothetical protein [Candidatus Regnicoccus frigidus MAG-AL2]